MPDSHQTVFASLEKLTFRELHSSARLIEVMREKVALLDPKCFTGQQCEAIARTFIAVIRDVLEDRYQDLSIRAFAHICVALDYFLDPSEQIHDASPGGLMDDLQFLNQTATRFAEDLRKYRQWQAASQTSG
jgi:uncharacterized membrane protein YkvA (DUF1232 family)